MAGVQFFLALFYTNYYYNFVDLFSALIIRVTDLLLFLFLSVQLFLEFETVKTDFSRVIESSFFLKLDCVLTLKKKFKIKNQVDSRYRYIANLRNVPKIINGYKRNQESK